MDSNPKVSHNLIISCRVLLMEQFVQKRVRGKSGTRRIREGCMEEGDLK
jgi:hypothetical protein